MPELLRTVAVRSEGIAELLDAVDRHGAVSSGPDADARAHKRVRRWIAELAAGRLRDELAAPGGPLAARLDALASQVVERRIDPITAAERLTADIG